MVLQWVRDGLNDEEKEAIDSILYVAVGDPSVAQTLLRMPFLSTYEPADTHALEGIRAIIKDNLTGALTSSRVYQSGINDAWAPIVAAAAATEDAAAIREYIDELSVTVESEERTTAELPLTITIIRLRNATGLNMTMENVYQAIADVETVMQLPLPTRHVIVSFDSRAVFSGFAGTNHGYMVGITEEEPDAGQEALRSTIRHEVAHYWWNSNARWIDEGMADTIAATASLAYGDNLAAQPNRRKDCMTRNLSSLGNTRRDAPASYCNYYLGEKLFRALQNSMTAGDFTAAIQALYRASRAKPEPRTLSEHRAGIDEVRQAFPYQQETVDLHYRGDINAPHRWDPDDAIDTKHHDVVIWTQKPTYVDGVVSFSGTLTGEATLRSRSALEAQQGGTSTFTLHMEDGTIGSILPERTDGRSWILEDAADVVAGQFEIVGNSFTILFRWPPTVGDPVGQRIVVWGFNNANRSPEMGSNADALGTSFIR